MFSIQKIIGVLSVFAVIAVLSFMLVSSKVEIGKLEVSNETLEKNIKTKEVLIGNYNKQLDIMSDANIELSKKFSKNDVKLDEQQKVYNSHNLEKLLDKKPQLIVNLANKKTKKLFKDFSKYTQEFENGEIGENNEK